MSRFKVGDRVRVVAEWSIRRGEEGVVSDHSDIASMWLVDLGDAVRCFGHDEIEFAGESAIPDLTTAELREWIADVVLVRRLAGDLSLGEGCELVRLLDPEGHGDNLIDLQDELLAEYATRCGS